MSASVIALFNDNDGGDNNAREAAETTNFLPSMVALTLGSTAIHQPFSNIAFYTTAALADDDDDDASVFPSPFPTSSKWRGSVHRGTIILVCVGGLKKERNYDFSIEA